MMKYSLLFKYVLLRDEIMLNLTVVLTFDLLNEDLGVQKLDTSISILTMDATGADKNRTYNYLVMCPFQTSKLGSKKLTMDRP